MKCMECMESGILDVRNLFEITEFKDLTEYFIKFHQKIETFSLGNPLILSSRYMII